MQQVTRTALITGGGSGIGKAICYRLARNGMAVGVLGMSAESVTAVATSINETGLGAQIGAPNMVHYTATKGAIIAMTRSLAIELGPKGITVNSVSPGFIDTPMARRAIDGGLFPVPYEQIIATYPIPRLGQPDDIAAACAFFASEDAGYVTAQVLGVNGGAAV